MEHYHNQSYSLSYDCEGCSKEERLICKFFMLIALVINPEVVFDWKCKGRWDFF